MTHSRSNFENDLLPDSKSFSRFYCRFPPSWFFSPVCLVAFSWITWSISVFHQPMGRSVCLSMQYLTDGVESMLLSSTSSGAACAAWGSDLNVLLCLMMSSWCNNVQISFSFFFLIYLFLFLSPYLLGFLHSTEPCRGPDTGAQLLSGLKHNVEISFVSGWRCLKKSCHLCLKLETEILSVSR